MFMVVILHILGQGGILENTDMLSTNYEIVWFLEIASLCAVNCYALISGYVSVDIEFKYYRIISLWLQVVFYTVIITMIFAIFVPNSVSIKAAINTVLPVVGKQYWYFTAYFAMFFFIPFLNHLINTLSQRNSLKLIITIVIIFSVIPAISRTDIFNTMYGYSPLWLMILYLVGGYIKKYSFGDKIKKKWYLVIYFCAIFVTWIGKFILEYVTTKLVGEAKGSEFLVKYTAPLIFVAGVSLLLYFSKCDFKKNIMKKIIKVFAPVSFSVYLIHLHPLVKVHIIGKSFQTFYKFNSIKLFFAVVTTAVIIYVFCSLIDLIRYNIFKRINIGKFSQSIEKKIGKILERLTKRIA